MDVRMEKFLNKWEILITIIISITSIFLAIKANEMTKYKQKWQEIAHYPIFKWWKKI